MKPSPQSQRRRTANAILWVTPFAVIAAVSILAVSGPFFRGTPETPPPLSVQPSAPLVRPTPAPPPPVRLIAVGDIMPGRYVEDVTHQYGYDYPYAATRAYLQEGDVVFANLESPLTDGARVPDGGMTFRADVPNAQALRDAGITVVSLANNHMMNAGAAGIDDTLAALDSAGVLHTGAGDTYDEAHAPVRVQIRGVEVAVFAYVEPGLAPPSAAATADRPGLALMREEDVATDIRSVRMSVDAVVISMHAGTEYTTVPTFTQRSLARAAIDAGADVVIGHHSHWVQETEEYGGGIILYGLGNFVFDQQWSQETREGVVATFTLTQDDVPDATYRAIVIDDRTQPHFVEGGAASSILARLDSTE